MIVTKGIQALANKRVGFVRILEPQVYRETYEVAAWWQNVKSVTGDFDLILRIGKDAVSVGTSVDGTVIDCYFAALFGGVPVGKGTGKENIGRAGKVPIGQRLEVAATEGRHTVKGVEFYIDLSLFDAIIAFAEANMQHQWDYLQRYGWPEYVANPRSNYQSTISMVAHCGMELEYWGRKLEKLIGERSWRTQHPQYERTQVIAEPVPA